MRALLARNGLAPGDLEAVELLGGGSRVPRVQAELQAALGGRALDKCGARAAGGGLLGLRRRRLPGCVLTHACGHLQQ